MTSDRLHLRNLSIRGFLGIKDLCIGRLGRVTLLTGRNGVGKTTVLDAVRVYAARGAFPALYQLLRRREEDSWDCVRGFAQAAVAAGESDCALVRLDRNGQGIRTGEYSCDDLDRRRAADRGPVVR